MNVLIGIIFIVIGLIPLIYSTFKEDGKTFFKMMIGASCGVVVFGGLVILLFL